MHAHIDSCSDFIESVHIHNVMFGFYYINGTQTNFVTKMWEINEVEYFWTSLPQKTCK